MSDDNLSENGVLEAYNLSLGFVPCMVAKAVCELGIPDILAAHAQQPLSALDIAQLLRPPPTRPLHEAAEQLDRMMRCLCSYKVFKAHVATPTQSHVEKSPQPDPAHDAHVEESAPTKYGLTPVSDLLLQCTSSLHGSLLLLLDSRLQDPFRHFSQSLLHGPHPFTAAHSMDIWSLTAADSSFSRLFHSGMASASTAAVRALLQCYDGFQHGIGTLVDVGGGTGAVASSIATHYPSIGVINFDLPAVIATAPIYPGVQHIGGDMFQSIPPADAIFMKCILHDWNDEDCIKVLNNCHKVLPRHGKLIIMDAVLSMEDSSFQNIRFAYDMLMLSCTTSGKERTKKQWEALLGVAKFLIHRIIDLPCPQCLIEAIPIEKP